MRRELLVVMAIVALGLALGACETPPNSNGNANANANMAPRSEATPTATPKYSEEQAREARAKDCQACKNGTNQNRTRTNSS